MNALAWLNPAYFAGLALLALPVLIHLVQRERERGFAFPSLMFLRRIPIEEKRRLQLRHRGLLLLRCLLLALLVLAFARPWFDDPAAGATVELGLRDSVVLIDRSWSMRRGDQWREARAAAQAIIDGRDARERIALLAFDERSELVAAFTADEAALRGRLARLEPGLRATRLRGGLEQAARMLAGSTASERRIVIISDFRANAVAAGERAVVPAGIDIELRPIAVAAADNSGVRRLTLEPAADGLALAVDVGHHGEAASTRLLLDLDGRQAGSRELALADGAVARVRFDGLQPDRAVVTGRVALDDDALAADNTARFVYSSRRRLPLLIVDGPNARSNQSLYLRQALAQSRDPLFAVDSGRWSSLEPDRLADYALIVINDAPLPGGPLREALRAFVDDGGGLLIATGEQVGERWPAGGAGFLPGGGLERIDSPPGSAASIIRLDRNHPLAAALADEGASLAPARFYSRRDLRPQSGDRVVAWFDDGRAALLERGFGAGRVLVLASTLDLHWNDLALQGAFLPFLHQGLRYLADYDAFPPAFRVGQTVDLLRYARAQAGADAVLAAAGRDEFVVETPSGAQLRLRRAAPLLSIEEPGFYAVHQLTPANAAVTLAANVDPLEADPAPLDVDAWLADIRRPATAVYAEASRASETEQRQRAWQLVLWAALALLLLEAIAANWIASRARRITEVT